MTKKNVRGAESQHFFVSFKHYCFQKLNTPLDGNTDSLEFFTFFLFSKSSETRSQLCIYFYADALAEGSQVRDFGSQA